MNTPENIPDVRGGWTSASNAAADERCPARHLKQRGLPGIEGPYAQSGNKVHAALAAFIVGSPSGHENRPLLDKLTTEERNTYTACVELQRKLVVQYFERLEPTYREYREQRYWARFKFGGQDYEHSGQADFVGRSGTRAIILDYKTMPGDVPHSSRNLQLRDLACLVRGTYVPTDEIAVGIIQPDVTMSPELCVYNKAQLEQATKEMFQRVVKSNDANAKPVAGELQCKYCRAAKAGTCAEYQEWAGAMTPPALLRILNVPIAAWTPEQCAVAASNLAPCEKFLQDLKDLLKEKLAKDPNAIPGWRLQPGAVRETIVNPQGVFERFSALGGRVEQFMPCVDVAKAKLKEALAKLTGAKGKSLETAMKTLTDGMTTEKQTAPSLKRVDKEDGK